MWFFVAREARKEQELKKRKVKGYGLQSRRVRRWVRLEPQKGLECTHVVRAASLRKATSTNGTKSLSFASQKRYERFLFVKNMGGSHTMSSANVDMTSVELNNETIESHGQ